MKKIHSIPFTREGYEKVKENYEKMLFSRKEAVKTLQEARELGDLSENGFYKAARAKLSSIDNNLSRLSMLIKLAVVTENKDKNTININSKVILNSGGKNREFQIVGPYESDPLNNKISVNSPLGKVLLEKRKGDTAVVSAPKGKVTYKIIQINN